MERYSFGAPDRSIIQFAYTVHDIEQGMRRYSELLHIGPWFLIGPFVPAKGVYRGAVTTMSISLAVAFAGEAMVELIEQHDQEPSVYQETLKARGGHGFHHWAIGAGPSMRLWRDTRRKATAKLFRISRRAACASFTSIRRPPCPACSKSSR